MNREKSVLYFSPVWTNIADYSLQSETESGMPAFTEPLKKLLDNGFKVHIIWILMGQKVTFSDPWFAKQKSISVAGYSKLSLIPNLVKLVFWGLVLILRHRPSLVYCHGSAAAPILFSANVLRVPAIVRVYGVNKYYRLQASLGNFKFGLKHPLVYLQFKLGTRCAIITDDGSRGDELCANIAPNRHVLFLKNGRPLIPSSKRNNCKDKRDIVCVGRIEPKKNLEGALEFFFEHASAFPDATLRFIGPVMVEEYVVKLQKMVQDNGLENRVKFVGGLAKTALFEIMSNASVNLSFQNHSNLSNSLIECLEMGCLVATFSEPSFVDEKTGNPKCGIIAENARKAAEIFGNLTAEDMQSLRAQNAQFAREGFSSWSERSMIEIDLIKEILSS